jgi:N-acetylmuramoyl-L-alanine amidase
MKICISSGHGKHIRGASGSPVPPQLDEVNEARKVVETVAEELRQRGAEVWTFHDDTSHDQSTNLHTITKWHNSKARDLDISVHFNAYNGSAHGTEVLYVTQEELAREVSEAIALAGRLANRGAKYRSDLYVLNNTEMPAILLEVCFCDNTSDSEKYRQNYAEICEAIAMAIVPAPAEAEPPGEAETPKRPPLMHPDRGGVVFMPNHTGITCTVFGGEADPQQSAYDGHWIDDQELGCALPYKWRETTPPRIFVFNLDNAQTAYCEVVDVGPWNTDDKDYVLGPDRPQAETGFDTWSRPTNGAGIDLTPGAAKAIGIDGLGKVCWSFVRGKDGEV